MQQKFRGKNNKNTSGKSHEERDSFPGNHERTSLGSPDAEGEEAEMEAGKREQLEELEIP